MKYMVVYTHQTRNKEGKINKRIDRMFRKIECDSVEEAKKTILNQIEEEERARAKQKNKVFNEGLFSMDYKIINVVKQ